jgi:phosphoribosylformylglycinamidine synthase
VLLRNANRQFVSKNIFVRGEGPQSRALMLPVAHGEGRYYADEKTLDGLEANGEVIFRYCDEEGAITSASNPNGSVRNIAGICNKNRNVFGMMPHPERASSVELGNIDGRLIFQALFINKRPEFVGLDTQLANF